MKILYKIFLLILLSIPFNKAFSQISLNIFGLNSQAREMFPNTDNGFGGGINILYGAPQRNDLKSKFGLKVQYGGGFYFSTFGQKSLEGILLDSPQTGTAHVNVYNSLIGINSIVRFTPSYNNGKYMPYLDVTVGVRITTGNETIMPDKPVAGYASETDHNINSTTGLNVGLSAGLLIKLGGFTYLDMGCIYSHTLSCADILDLNTVQKVSDGYTYDLKMVSQDIFILKLGLVFDLDVSGESVSSHGGQHTQGSAYSYPSGYGGYRGGMGSSVHSYSSPGFRGGGRAK